MAGVSSEGFTTTALPQASAGATFQVSSSSGRFQGVMIPTTPERLADGVVQRALAVGSFGLESFEPGSLDQVGEGAEIGGGAGNVQLAMPA